MALSLDGTTGITSDGGTPVIENLDTTETGIDVTGVLTTTGNVGIGTNSPNSFYSLADNLVVGTGSGGNGMTIYSGSADSGFIGFNDTVSASMQAFIQYNHNGDYMAFAPNGSEKMRITSAGDLLLNTPAAGLQNAGNVGIVPSEGRLYLNTTGTTGTIFCNQSYNDTAGRYQILFYRNEVFVGAIISNTTSTSYITSSDYRLKENVVEITDGIDRVKLLNPSRFNFISNSDTTVDGFLAHEVQEVVPEAIAGAKDATKEEEYEVTPAVLDDDGNVVTEAVMGTRTVPDYQGIDQSKLVPLLTAALQEAITKIEALEARVTALENA